MNDDYRRSHTNREFPFPANGQIRIALTAFLD